MRKYLFVITLILLLSFAFTSIASANSDVKVFVNNEEVISENSYFSNGEIKIPISTITDLLIYNIPIKLISHAFGINIVWDTKTNSVYIETKYLPPVNIVSLSKEALIF